MDKMDFDVFISYSRKNFDEVNNIRKEILSRIPDLEGIDGQKALGSCHISFSVGGKEAVDVLTNCMKEDGFEVIDGPRTTGDGYYESCVVGIDGNLIEITE